MNRSLNIYLSVALIWAAGGCAPTADNAADSAARARDARAVTNDNGVETMAPDSESIEQLRAEFAPRLMAIDGVESVTVGTCEDGSPCLVIGTSVPIDEVRDRLPEELAEQPIALEYQGSFGDHAASLMDSDHQAIEQLRVTHEAVLLEIEGVVFVTAGICESGKPCLMIGTSVPAEEVRAQLPEDLPETEVEIKYVGELRIQ
jgi:hypothetical protein